jgi:peroxiredoxin
VTCIPTGERLPAWSGPLAGGGTFDSASLAGRPAVVWLRPASMCGGPCPAGETDDLRAAQEVADAFEGRVSVAIVSQGERQQGETERAMRDLGIDLPLVFDWDGTIAERLQVGVLGVIVLDADGRVAATWSITPGRPTATEIEAALEAILPGPR